MRKLYLDELSVGSWVSYGGEPGCFVVRLDGVYLCCVGGSVVRYGDLDMSLLEPLLLDDVLLRGFGFVPAKGENVWLLCRGGVRLTVSLRMRGGRWLSRRCALTGSVTPTWNEEIRYVHELQRWWVEKVLVPFGIGMDLEWRVV